MLIVLGGKAPTTLAVIDTTGAVSWHRNLRASFQGPSPDCFVQGANGAVLAITGIDEEKARYLVIDQRGDVAFDTVIDGEQGYWELELSPSGTYYYRVRQTGHVIRLLRVDGRTPRLIDLEEVLPDFVGDEFLVHFLTADRFVVSQSRKRFAVLDLSLDPAGIMEISDDIRKGSPWLIRSYADDSTYYEATGHIVSRYDLRGRVVWSKRTLSPRIVRASDRNLVAVLGSNTLEVLDAASGQVCGAVSIPNELSILWVSEARFSEKHLIANVNAGSGTQLMTLIMSISESGTILEEDFHDFIACGLGPTRPVLGVVTQYGSPDTSLVVAFRKAS